MWRKHRIAQRLYRPIIGVLLLILSFGTISQFIHPSKVYAAASDFSPAQRAAAWNAGLGLSNCSNDAGWVRGRSPDDINKGEVFGSSRDNFFISTGDHKIVGYLVDSGDGTITCSEGADIVLLFNAIGEKPLDFLKATGVYALNSDKTQYETRLKDDAARSSAIRVAVEKKYGFNYGSGMPKDMQYAALLATFNKKCLGTPDDQGISVSIVDSTGKVNPVTYSLKGGANDVMEVGYSLDGDGGGDQKMSCPTIVKQMNLFANDYAATVTANAADSNHGNDSENSGGQTGLSDSKPTCETSGNPMTWILCPVFNGVADFSDWMFRNMVEPLLRTAPVSTDPSNPSFQIWSSFRLYGNIILIVSMLVIVFSQAIGGGVVDAYTAKKVMPRIIVAAILVNLSIYIVAFMVDITNILGGGIGQLMTAPLGSVGQFSFSPNASQSILIGGGTILGFLGSIVFVGAIGIGAAASFLALFVLLPAALGILGAFLTLVIRQGIILMLILVSPVAFALYCLPNTEKYFRKWWEALFKALLVYPIVIVIFAAADILAVTVQKANGFGNGPLLTQVPANAIAGIVAFVAMFLPLALIPFAFKLAGGAVGNLHAQLTNFNKKGVEFVKGNVNDPNSLRNSTRRRVGGNLNRARAQFVRANANSGNLVRRTAGRRLNFGNVLDKESEFNEDAQKRMGRTSGVGDDHYIRARTSLPLFLTEGGAQTIDESLAGRDAKGKAIRARDDNGNAIRMSLNGQKRFTDYDYEKSTQLYRTQGELQESLNYEGKKARSAGHADDFVDNFAMWANREGFTKEQATGVFQGVGFSRQQKRKEWKHTKVKKNNAGRLEMVRPHQSLSKYTNVTDPATGRSAAQMRVGDEGAADAFVDEAYTDMGSWIMSQESDSTIEELGRVKDVYATELGRLSAAGPLDAAQQASKKNISTQLSKIQAMEETWVGDPQKTPRGGTPAGVINDEGTPGYTGLSGAPEAVQAAARAMAQRDARVVDSEGNTRDIKVRKRYDTNTGAPKVEQASVVVTKTYPPGHAHAGESYQVMESFNV